MPDTDLEIMVAAMSVDIKKMERELKRASGLFDRETVRWEKRASKTMKAINERLGRFTGFSGLKSTLMGATAVGIVGGLGTLVTHALDAASAIGETATKAGISTNRLQELRFAASQTGSSFDAMDSAAIKFNKNFGDLLNTGKGTLAQPFKALGLDKMVQSGQIRTTEQALDSFLEKVAGVGTTSQRAAYLAAAFGRLAGPQMAELVEQGAAGIAKLRNEAHALGIVLDEKTIKESKESKDKLQALFDVMKAQGTAAIAGNAKEIENLAEAITQEAIPALILWMEKWGEFFGVMKVSPVLKLRDEIATLQADIAKFEGMRGKKNEQNNWWDPLGLFTLSDHEIGVFVDENKKRLEKARGELAIAEGNASLFKSKNGKPWRFTTADAMRADLQSYNAPPKAHIPDPNAAAAARAAEAEARRAEAMAARVQEIIARTGADAKTAAAALVAAKSQATVEMLRGTEGYFDAVKEQIAEELAARIAGFEAERAEQVRHLSALDMTQEQHMKAWGNIQREYEDKRAAATVEADAKIAAAGEEQSGAMARSIEMADSLRGALVNVGVAGLHGFKSMKDAMASTIEQIAELILRLYVLGSPGTQIDIGGGGGGGFLSTMWSGIKSLIPGFASGTGNAPGGMALVGENGPELVNLPKHSQVIPTRPTQAMMASLRPAVGGVSLSHTISVVVQGSADEASLKAMRNLLEQDRRGRRADVETIVHKMRRDRKLG